MNSFSEWQATRRECADLGEALQATFHGVDGERVAVGFIYDGDCYIEKREGGKFYLLIEREDWISDDLEYLETLLFAWCATEFGEYTLDADSFARVVAVEFVSLLSRYVYGAQWQEMCRKNGTADYPLGVICPSHDYCDANMVMYDAYVKTCGYLSIEPAADLNDALEPMEQAWNFARANLMR